MKASNGCTGHAITTGGNWSPVPPGRWGTGSVSDAPLHLSVVLILTQTSPCPRPQLPTALYSGDRHPVLIQLQSCSANKHTGDRRCQGLRAERGGGPAWAQRWAPDTPQSWPNRRDPGGETDRLAAHQVLVADLRVSQALPVGRDSEPREPSPGFGSSPGGFSLESRWERD